jgi:hypothetical protein
MSIQSRALQVGDTVITDFSRTLTTHRIVAVCHKCVSQSGTMYKVMPVVPKSSGGWIDADWFEVAQ